MNPIERAAIAVYEAGPGYELTGGKPWEDISRSSQDNMVRNARAAFNSIDVDELAEAIHGDQCPEDPDPGDYCTCDGGHYDRLALVVKNWLTGKDQQ